MNRPPDQRPPSDELSTEAARSQVGATYVPGQIIGQRYRISGFLGRGGMGEVWQAFDLKLRVDVALKTLRRDRATDEQMLELLRREVRSAREVVSPNVCRIFDLVEIDGQELVSMEYIDGTTLVGVLRERGPLELHEATEIAAQFLAGLEEIHRAGLVHRDVKPENIMITRPGRVVLMDFGLAKPDTEAGSSRVAGTPAYMSPEQVRGDQLDARTDIFAAGVVLAEMVHARGIRDRESRDTLQRGLHRDPPEIPDSPWRQVLLRAVAGPAEDRYPSARELGRALEEIALGVEGAEVLRPYPGLASFSAADAEYFFGREVEVETVWKKLSRPHLLALIGPSGAGKSSFLQAGLIPAMPAGWRCVVCQPGDAPHVALARALAPELTGDSEAIGEMVRFEVPDVAVSLFARWRRRHAEALLVVDQFEELFTLNPPAVQQRFAELISRLALESDLHVMLSMRDDFLFRCHEHSSLTPLFSELTPLGPPTGAALRRAVVQPALKCGHRFEDDALVDEMLGEVAEERGALPLLAFAVARLWEERDRDSGLLTREAYERLGGVGGALAQHAEATLERIGAERLPVVREIFRNLVTAQGTRAARDSNELLSVFDDQESSREVLSALIGARLLTSFEVPADDGSETAPRRRVEIIHESLLTAWPRLVRWRTQDADSAQLRDQLRQAAQMWSERGQPDELLWSGTTFREFQVWRERYPGGLTATEEAFSRAMVVHAERRRRRRLIAVVTSFAVLLGVLALVAGLWRKSDFEALSAEAARLVAAGHFELDYKGQMELRDWSFSGPSVAMAHALASLELVDNADARELAVETLWRAPPGFFIPDPPGEHPIHVDFSPDGQWLAASYDDGGPVKIWPAGGGDPIEIAPGGRDDMETADPILFGPDSESLLFIHWYAKKIRVWSIPGGKLLRTFRFPIPSQAPLTKDGRLIMASPSPTGGEERCFESRPLDGGQPVSLGCASTAEGQEYSSPDPKGNWLAYEQDRDVFIVPLDALEESEPRRVGRHDSNPRYHVFDPTGERLALMGDSGLLSIWSTAEEQERPLRSFQVETYPLNLWFAATGTTLVTGSTEVNFWELETPPESNPVEITRTSTQYRSMALHPDGTWIAVAAREGVAIFPTASRRSRILRVHDRLLTDLAFLPDGKSIASVSLDRVVRLSPLVPAAGERTRDILEGEIAWGLAAAPSGRFVLVGSARGHWQVPLDGAPPRRVSDLGRAVGVAVSPDGRLLAGGGFLPDDSGNALSIRNLETDEERVLDVCVSEDGAAHVDVHFISEREVVSSCDGKLRVWDLETDDSRIVVDGGAERFAVSRDGRHVLTCSSAYQPSGIGVAPQRGAAAVYHDLESGTSRRLTSHGTGVTAVAFDPTGSIAVTVGLDGIVRAGPVTGEPPHLMFGHEGRVFTVDVSPDGRWIASGGVDKTIRLWPMPLGQPLHTLPRAELIERLRRLTNLRLVRDTESATGYRIEIDRFPGWKTTPEW